MSSFNMSEFINSLSEVEKEKVIALTLLVKDVNKVPYKAFQIVSKVLGAVMSDEEETVVESVSLMILQYLSISNLLISNVDDEELAKEDFNKVKVDDNSLTNLTRNFVKDYKEYNEQLLIEEAKNQIRTAFVTVVAEFTSDQDILTSATNFIFYHSNIDCITEDDKVTIDLALINLIKLCIKQGYKEQLKALLIDVDVDIDSFIIQHIQMFVS